MVKTNKTKTLMLGELFAFGLHILRKTVPQITAQKQSFKGAL